MKFLSDFSKLRAKFILTFPPRRIFSFHMHPYPSFLAIYKSDGSIFEHLRISRHLDSTVVNYLEQMYAPFVVLRFSLDRTLANCLWPFMYPISKKEKKEKRKKMTIVDTWNIVLHRIATRHATFDNFIIINSCSRSRKLCPLIFDRGSCSKSIMLLRANVRLKALMAGDRPRAIDLEPLRVYDEILNHSNRNAYTFRFDFLIICDNTFCKKGIINRVLSTEWNLWRV